MVTMQKLRSQINAKLKGKVTLKLIKYKLRTVAKEEKFGYTVIDIEHVQVDETIKNKGMGKLVLKAIIETLFENNVDAIVITASNIHGTDISKLINLYKGVGFNEIRGGVKGAMYMINKEKPKFIQDLAEHSIIRSSQMQLLSMIRY